MTTKETVELDIKTQLIIIIHKRWVVVVVVDSRISWVASPPSPSFTMIVGRREDGENEISKEISWGGGESTITQEKKIISTEENSTEIYKRKV